MIKSVLAPCRNAICFAFFLTIIIYPINSFAQLIDCTDDIDGD